jgi:methylated-DNA-[protein]-cysteine S-methyltransferase
VNHPSDTRYDSVPSPIGDLLVLIDDEDRLAGLYVGGEPGAPAVDAAWRPAGPAASAARQQLDAYFAGELTDFDLEVAPSGTPFQLEVWSALSAIPYGETVSYRDVADEVGRPHASRAVGQANGHNPISIVIPCHRVVAAGGGLGGYGWGLDRKRWLLDHETRVLISGGGAAPRTTRPAAEGRARLRAS